MTIGTEYDYLLDELTDELEALNDELAEARAFLQACGIHLKPETPLIEGIQMLMHKGQGQMPQHANEAAAGVQQLALFAEGAA